MTQVSLIPARKVIIEGVLKDLDPSEYIIATLVQVPYIENCSVPITIEGITDIDNNSVILDLPLEDSYHYHNPQLTSDLVIYLDREPQKPELVAIHYSVLEQIIENSEHYEKIDAYRYQVYQDLITSLYQ